MNWYVLYVRPRQEKQVAQLLKSIGVEVYCPLVKETRQWSDRKKQVEVPLFKSYVFVRLAENNRCKVFEVPGIVRYLFWLGKPAMVRDVEIETIKEWLTNDKVANIRVSRLEPGQEIIIGQGLLKDKKATIQKVGKSRVCLILKELNMIINIKVKEIEHQLAP